MRNHRAGSNTVCVQIWTSVQLKWMHVTRTVTTTSVPTPAAVTPVATLSTLMDTDVMVHLKTLAIVVGECVLVVADINECLEGRVGNTTCPEVCVNTPGSWRCGCLPGKTLRIDGIKCRGRVESPAVMVHQCSSLPPLYR